jgi:hypothetical protein
MTVDLLVIGLAIALEPLPLTAYLLMLTSEGGTRKGLGFIAGWMLTLIGVIVLTLLVTGGKPPASGSAPSTAALLAKIVIGVVLLLVAWRQRARRGRPVAKPSWMAKIDKLGFVAAMALGFLLQPWPLVAAGAAAVTAANLSQPSSLVALVLFALLATASYIAMEVYTIASPDAARSRLDALRDQIARHRDQAVIVLSVGAGVWLIGSSAYLLAT